MPTVLVDGIEVAIGDKERLNGIQAAARAGIDIPYYCWHPGLSVVASCRMCLVEAGKKDEKTGKIAMQPRLVPACQTPATDGGCSGAPVAAPRKTAGRARWRHRSS